MCIDLPPPICIKGRKYSHLCLAILAAFSLPSSAETITTAVDTVKHDSGTSYVAVNVDENNKSWNSDLLIKDISKDLRNSYGLIGYYQSSENADISGNLDISNLSISNTLERYDSFSAIAGAEISQGTFSSNGRISVSGLTHTSVYDRGEVDSDEYVKGISLSSAVLEGVTELHVDGITSNLSQDGSIYGVDWNDSKATSLSQISVSNISGLSPMNGDDSANVYGLNVNGGDLGSQDNRVALTITNISTRNGNLNGVNIKNNSSYFDTVNIQGLNQGGTASDSLGTSFFGFQVSHASKEQETTSVDIAGTLSVSDLDIQGLQYMDAAAVMVGSEVGRNDTDNHKNGDGRASLTATEISVSDVDVKSTGSGTFFFSGVAVGRDAELTAEKVLVSDVEINHTHNYNSSRYNRFMSGFSANYGTANITSLTVENIKDIGGLYDSETIGVINTNSQMNVGDLTVNDISGKSVYGVLVTNYSRNGDYLASLSVNNLKITNLSGSKGDVTGISVEMGGEVTVSNSALINVGEEEMAVVGQDSTNIKFLGNSFKTVGTVLARETLVLNAKESYLTGSLRAESSGALITGENANGIFEITRVAQPLNWIGNDEYGRWTGESENIDALYAEDEDSALLPNTMTEPEEYATIDLNRNMVIRSQNSKEYEGADTAHEGFIAAGAAVRANAGGKILLDDSESHYEIYGNVIAGNGSDLLTMPGMEQTLEDILSQGNKLFGGRISLGGKDLQLVGDVFAANGGKISLDLNGNALFEGRADDYHELKDELKGQVFHNATFVSNDCALKDGMFIHDAGDISITMSENATWIARGQSFVNSLAFSEGFDGKVDLSKDENSSLSIGTLSGSGNFVMRLNADPSKSDMLYVRTLENGANYTITMPETVTRDVASFEDLHGLRIATSNSGEASFKVQMKDMGVRNLTLDVVSEKYDENDPDNVRYNGEGNGEGVWKPGDDVVTEVYGDNGKNWIIDVTSAQEQIKNEAAEQTLSDAAQALIGTARGTYWNAIEIDRFSNRAGDMRYVSGTEGAWVRVRHSRFGTDSGVGNFRSEGMTYQVGYDHAFITNGGRQIVGAAFDYLDNDVDYRSFSGNGNVDRYGLTVYSTWLGDNGGYVDIVGRYGVLDNDFTITNGSGRVVKADYQNHILGLSAEVGHKLTNDSTGWFLEPSVQLQYVRVTEADYATNQGTMVDQEGIDSVISRAGFRFGKMFEGNKSGSVYAKADWFREYQGEQTLNFKDITTSRAGDAISIDNKGNWFDVGLGAQIGLGDNAFGFADVEYRFGNDLERTWIFNIGGRLTF